MKIFCFFILRIYFYFDQVRHKTRTSWTIIKRGHIQGPYKDLLTAKFGQNLASSLEGDSLKVRLQIKAHNLVLWLRWAKILTFKGFLNLEAVSKLKNVCCKFYSALLGDKMEKIQKIKHQIKFDLAIKYVKVNLDPSFVQIW